MDASKPKTETARALGELSTSLFELRDAFLQLSMSLRDLQFETDLNRRREAEQHAQQLLEHIMSTHDRSA